MHSSLVLFELISYQRVIWTFWHSLRLTKARVSLLRCLVFLFWEVSHSDLHTLPWPVLKTFVAMTTWGVREGCAYLKGRMLLSSYGGSSLHKPTQTAQHIEPRNLRFESVSAFSICSHARHFFCPSKARLDGCWRRKEKSREGLWCIIYPCSGWAEDMGCELGEERWVGRIKKSGSWRVGRGNPTLSHFPCYPSLCQVL